MHGCVHLIDALGCLGRIVTVVLIAIGAATPSFAQADGHALAALATVSIWGVLESVLLASFFTVIEISGLAIIVVFGLINSPSEILLFSIPSDSLPSWPGIIFATVLAFFAFIGFEDLTNMAEETIAPERVMPIAMGMTLLATTVLYMLVVAVAVTSIPVNELAASEAPLSEVFTRLTGVSSAVISLIAIVATLNTILAEMTMATRVLYGMARQGDLPRHFGFVHHHTSTPVLATLLVAALIFLLTLVVPFIQLAEATSVATLTIFALVNLALIRIRLRDGRGPHFSAPLWMPVAGLLTSIGLIVGLAAQ